MGASTIFSRAFNGKLMILFLVILFIACFVIILFHVYSRWFRNRRHRHRRRRRRQFHHSTTAVAHQGLDLSVMYSIPTFIYESNAHDPSMECAVCLCEFEDKETGRVLPECKHNFHIDCIDPWLRTHSDCPICRTRVESSRVPIVNPLERVVVVTETDRAGEEDLTQVDCPSSTSSSSSPTVDLKIKQPN